MPFSTERLYGWNDIQAEILALSDEQLQELFQTSTLTDSFSQTEQTLKAELNKCEEQEIILYGVPKPVTTETM